jgi:hypothetical protein
MLRISRRLRNNQNPERPPELLVPQGIHGMCRDNCISAVIAEQFARFAPAGEDPHYGQDQRVRGRA